jgi:TRAP-type C4-dicarboxylate transport system substrate-binding protein
MKSRKTIALMTALLMLTALLTACATNAGDASTEEGTADQPLTIQWASQNNPTMASGKTSLYTVEEIDRLSNGTIQIDYHDQGKLGYDAELIQQVIDGTIPIVTVGLGVFSQYTDLLEAVQLPFLITNYEQEYEVVRSPEFLALLEQAGTKVGLKLIGTQENGVRHFANNIRPINTVSDLSGMKIRVPQNAILMETMTLLGANPIPLAYNEVYTALQNKVVDGEEINYTSMAAQKHYEVVKYASTIGFYPYMAVTAIKCRFLERADFGATGDYLAGACECGRKVLTGWIQEDDQNSLAICEEKGVEVNTVEDVDSFRDVVMKLYDEYKEKDPLIKTFIESVES